ncbi:MAG TPA: hypothetical protein VF885_14465, partial [Arthrobacter sp.]
KDGRSYSRLSEDCGGNPAARRIQQMANGARPMRNFPDPETVTALAAGLGVSTQEVLLASARSLGIDVDGTSKALVIPGAMALPESAQRVVTDLARELLRAYGR